MASIYKHRSNKWVAVIRHPQLKTRTKSFHKYADAKEWAKSEETKLSTRLFQGSHHTLHEAIDRYQETFITKFKSIKTAKWELQFLKRHIPNERLDTFQSTQVAQYRDDRLSRGVSGSSINRELNTLSRVFDIAMKEWCWVNHNPVKQITRPKNGRHRERRPTSSEIISLRNECARSRNNDIWIMIELAIETGMRQGELLNLETASINLQSRIAHLHETKNGESRSVPLSKRACDLVKIQLQATASEKLFPRWSGGDGFRSTFKRVCERAGIKNLRFHDLRHEAASRFFEMGLNQFQVAAITGHKSLQSLHRYTHIKTENLVNLIS